MLDAHNVNQPPIDPATVFHQNTYLRRSIIASYWLVILLAVPLWWRTTSIERLSLPTSRVASQSESYLRLPVRLHLDTPNAGAASALQSLLDESARRDPDRWNGLDVLVSSTKINGNSGDSSYTIINSPTILIDGRKLYYPSNDLNALADVLTSLIVPGSHSYSIQRVAQYSPRYRLAFSLLNQDAAAGRPIVDWDITSAIDHHLSPIFTYLSTLHNFTIESQVQFHAPLAFEPRQLPDGSSALTHEQLTIFINSAEWSLSSSASNDPVLHFVLFVPSIRHSPLRILNADGTTLSPSNAFLLPQWGTIHLHNPPSNSPSAGPTLLTLTDLSQPFNSFAMQLLTLLGVPSLPPTISRSPHATVTTITQWQLDALMRRRALENSERAKDTLGSIIKLVDKIQNMPVGKEVRNDVVDALSELDQMHTTTHTSLTHTLEHSAHALTLSSRAFFNPTMLALLYFPAEHTYAVYTPLFASALIPLVVTTVREFKAWRKQRKQRGGVQEAKQQ
ncbi:hypothetical protein AMATHDRAFT_147864 [Amanita thiersii Skay4041]|uniref:GPI transamidase component PIG-S n=1 Tax=Amanita thiersii Skay4041 TaxID=703135 RepID=A0A2A9NNQ6_9AGAR|nr:hypothetical protein AMATHDRAFT_147864 [Amanita thiersii Skay4041]